MKTTLPAVRDIKREWLLVDAQDQILGRMATRIALILRGKHKVIFTPHLDTGDFVIVINAKNVKVTGNKLKQKLYRRYSGYPNGLSERTLEEQLERHPELVLQQAVKRMLPAGPLGRQLLTKLKIYPGPAHPHGAQQPQPAQLLPARGAGSTNG